MSQGGSAIPEQTTSELLQAWKRGDAPARDQLFALLYNELRSISAALLRNERKVSLSTGDLVNEAAMRLINLNSIDWQDKAHFMAMASRMMRRVLIDHARKKQSDKRGHHRVTLMTQIMDGAAETIDLLKLEQALIRLQVIDSERANIVEMRYFGGLNIKEIAVVTGASESTVKRNWRSSRAWLLSAMEEF